jgi:tetratricopeptide (TPR) repeat protein
MNDAAWMERDDVLLGVYYTNGGRYTQAMEKLSGAPAEYQRLGDKRGLAFANYNIGRDYFLQNEYEQAQELFASALQLAQQDPNRVADSEVQLGWVYARLGDMAHARETLTEALQLIEKNHYGELLPSAYDALGEFNREAGDMAEARRNFRRASDLWKQTYVSEFSIEARCNLGLLEAENGDSARGMADCQQALVRAQQAHRAHTVARNAINLARIYLLRKEYQKAADVVNEITSPTQANLGLELRAEAFFYRGKALEGAGRTSEEAASYAQAKAAISKLEEKIAVEHRKSFAARREIKPLLAVKQN